MNGLELSRETWLVLALVGLALFGVLFNRKVMELEEETPDHGYTAFLVAGGVLVTVAVLTPFIGLAAALILLAGFAASGVPMMAGSVGRYLRRMQAERAALRAEAQRSMDDGDAS